MYNLKDIYQQLSFASRNSGDTSGGALRSKGDIPTEACAAYGTLNTQQTERRDSSECPAYEVVEIQQEVEQDGRNVYENAETF